MAISSKTLTRRELIVSGGRLAAGAASVGIAKPLFAAGQAIVDVAYAGSMGSMMEGPLKSAVAQDLKLEMHGRAQGSSALAQLIVGRSIRPDVFISVTPGPMLSVLRAGKAQVAQPIAHTEMVVAYSPRSRFAPQFDDAAKGKIQWWEVLQSLGLRFGRTDPVADPQGRNIIFTMMLAAKIYNQPQLVEKILGPAINEKQIFSEPTVEARLQSGELDAASAYKIQPAPFNVPYINLPREINLSAQNVRDQHPDVTLTVGGKTYSPEPLIYYAAALKDGPNPQEAAKFIDWLRGDRAQEIFRSNHYDAPGDASALHP